MVTATHIREKNLDDPSFDVVWATAQRLDVAVCTHGGGQAPGQTPFAIERFDTRLGIHAITHPVGAMQAVYNFTVGGILHRFPELRVGFMEAGVGWLPFWLERLDEHWERMPEQAPQIDRPPSEYFRGRCFLDRRARREHGAVGRRRPRVRTSSATPRTTATGTACSRTR